MKPFPTQDIAYFIGKMCSVFVTPSSRDLKLEDTRNYPASVHRYFLGVVESIDEYGLVLKQTRGLKVFVTKDHLIAIAEEEVLDPENPQDAEEIKRAMAQMDKMKKQTDELEKRKLSSAQKSPFVDPEAMKRIADDLSKNFGEKS